MEAGGKCLRRTFSGKAHPLWKAKSKMHFNCPLARKGSALLVTLALAGCSGMNYAMENYTGVPIVPFKFGDDTYRVFDKPRENRLMITPSLGAAANAGAVKGITLGLSGPMTIESDYRKVTQAYLDSTGRKCVTGKGKLVVQPQWEFEYRCH